MWKAFKRLEIFYLGWQTLKKNGCYLLFVKHPQKPTWNHEGGEICLLTNSIEEYLQTVYQTQINQPNPLGDISLISSPFYDTISIQSQVF